MSKSSKKRSRPIKKAAVATISKSLSRDKRQRVRKCVKSARGFLRKGFRALFRRGR